MRTISFGVVDFQPYHRLWWWWWWSIGKFYYSNWNTNETKRNEFMSVSVSVCNKWLLWVVGKFVDTNRKKRTKSLSEQNNECIEHYISTSTHCHLFNWQLVTDPCQIMWICILCKELMDPFYSPEIGIGWYVVQSGLLYKQTNKQNIGPFWTI